MLKDQFAALNQNAERWTLADDSQLCTLLDTLSNSIQTRVIDGTRRLEAIEHEATKVSGLVSDLNSRLDFYAAKQFIEHRVCDDYPASPTATPIPKIKTQVERQEEAIENVKQAVALGFKMIQEKFKRIDIRMEDFEDSSDLTFLPEPVFEPYDPHLARPLPFILDTPEWASSSSAGLREPSPKQLEDNNDVVVDLPSVKTRGSRASSSASSKRLSKTAESEESKKSNAQLPFKPRKGGIVSKLSPEFAAKIGAGPSGSADHKAFPAKPSPNFLASQSRGIESLFTDSESGDDIFIGFSPTKNSARPIKDVLKESVRKDSDRLVNLFSSDSSEEEWNLGASLDSERKKPIKLERGAYVAPEFKNRLAGLVLRGPGPSGIAKPAIKRAVSFESRESREIEASGRIGVDEPFASEAVETGFQVLKKRTRAPTRRLPKRYKEVLEKAAAEEARKKKVLEIKELLDYLLDTIEKVQGKEVAVKRRKETVEEKKTEEKTAEEVIKSEVKVLEKDDADKKTEEIEKEEKLPIMETKKGEETEILVEEAPELKEETEVKLSVETREKSVEKEELSVEEEETFQDLVNGFKKEEETVEDGVGTEDLEKISVEAEKEAHDFIEPSLGEISESALEVETPQSVQTGVEEEILVKDENYSDTESLEKDDVFLDSCAVLEGDKCASDVKLPTSGKEIKSSSTAEESGITSSGTFKAKLVRPVSVSDKSPLRDESLTSKSLPSTPPTPELVTDSTSSTRTSHFLTPGKKEVSKLEESSKTAGSSDFLDDDELMLSSKDVKEPTPTADKVSEPKQSLFSDSDDENLFNFASAAFEDPKLDQSSDASLPFDKVKASGRSSKPNTAAELSSGAERPKSLFASDSDDDLFKQSEQKNKPLPKEALSKEGKIDQEVLHNGKEGGPAVSSVQKAQPSKVRKSKAGLFDDSDSDGGFLE